MNLLGSDLLVFIWLLAFSHGAHAAKQRSRRQTTEPGGSRQLRCRTLEERRAYALPLSALRACPEGAVLLAFSF